MEKNRTLKLTKILNESESTRFTTIPVNILKPSNPTNDYRCIILHPLFSLDAALFSSCSMHLSPPVHDRQWMFQTCLWFRPGMWFKRYETNGSGPQVSHFFISPMANWVVFFGCLVICWFLDLGTSLICDRWSCALVSFFVRLGGGEASFGIHMHTLYMRESFKNQLL